MISWLIDTWCVPDSVYVPACGGILRVPADTPDELWEQTLAAVRAALRLLETKP